MLSSRMLYSISHSYGLAIWQRAQYIGPTAHRKFVYRDVNKLFTSFWFQKHAYLVSVGGSISKIIDTHQSDIVDFVDNLLVFEVSVFEQ